MNNFGSTKKSKGDRDLKSKTPMHERPNPILDEIPKKEYKESIIFTGKKNPVKIQSLMRNDHESIAGMRNDILARGFEDSEYAREMSKSYL